MRHMYKCHHIGCDDCCKSKAIQKTGIIGGVTEGVSCDFTLHDKQTKKPSAKKLKKSEKSLSVIPCPRYKPKTWNSIENYYGDAETTVIAPDKNTVDKSSESDNSKKCFCIAKFLAQPFVKRKSRSTNYENKDDTSQVNAPEEIVNKKQKKKLKQNQRSYGKENESSESSEDCPKIPYGTERTEKDNKFNHNKNNQNEFSEDYPDIIHNTEKSRKKYITDDGTYECLEYCPGAYNKETLRKNKMYYPNKVNQSECSDYCQGKIFDVDLSKIPEIVQNKAKSRKSKQIKLTKNDQSGSPEDLGLFNSEKSRNGQIYNPDGDEECICPEHYPKIVNNKEKSSKNKKFNRIKNDQFFRRPDDYSKVVKTKNIKESKKDEIFTPNENEQCICPEHYPEIHKTVRPKNIKLSNQNIRKKILCLCRKLSQKTTSSVSKWVGKQNSNIPAEKREDIVEKTVQDAVDQVDEPSFQMSIGATNMTVLNVDETVSKLNALGKKKVSCRCPSSKIRRNLEFSPRKICSTGICKRVQHKSTYFDCKCRKPEKFCSDQTCDLKNKPLLKPADRIKPIFNVNLDADSMRILNAEQVHDRIVRYEKMKCKEGRCAENTKRGFNCRCFFKKRPIIIECGNETCKKCGCNPCKCMTGSPSRRHSKYFHKRGNLEICVAPPKCGKCVVCPAKGAGECVCNNSVNTKNKKVSKRKSLQKNVHRRQSLAFRFKKNDNHPHTPNPVGTFRFKNNYNQSRITNLVGPTMQTCVCDKCQNKILVPVPKTPDPCQNIRSPFINHSNNIISREGEASPDEFECQCKLEMEKQWANQKHGKIPSKLTAVSLKNTASNKIQKSVQKKKPDKKNVKKKKKTLNPEQLEKQKRAKEKEKLKKAEKEKKKKKKKQTIEKRMARRAKRRRAEEKAYEKWRRREIKKINADMGKGESNCFVALVLGTLKMVFGCFIGLLNIIFSCIINPKVELRHAYYVLSHPIETQRNILLWIKRRWELRKLKIQSTFIGSRTLTILADEIQSRPLYQTIAPKGNTPQERRKIEEKNKKRMIRMDRRKNEALYSCKHMILVTLRKTPCLWCYYFCPNMYPQCLSCVKFWRDFSNMAMFFLAMLVWTPCILAYEMCRGMLCCMMCTA